MQRAVQATDVAPQRRAAIAETIAQIREVEARQGVTREALQEIKALMLALAERQELFPAEDFPAQPDGSGNNAIYRLAEDDDHRFALYMSTAQPGKKVPPHNHTTWAVIVGVDGDEENFFYERLDDGSEPGQAQIRLAGEAVVSPGTGVTLMPDDIHHIQVTGDRPTLHLHMYGRALDHLPERLTFDMEQGTCRVYPASPNIRDAR